MLFGAKDSLGFIINILLYLKRKKKIITELASSGHPHPGILTSVVPSLGSFGHL